MAGPLRLEFPNARHHVMALGNDRRPIFVDDRDRRRFLGVLAALPERDGVLVHAWVLMDDHVHLLLETPEANVGRACPSGRSTGPGRQRRRRGIPGRDS